MQPVWNPLTLLPEEVWAIALAYITDPLDIISCYNAHPLFRNIIDRSKDHFQICFHLLFNYLSMPDILKCRLISSNWKSTIDGHLETYQFISRRCSIRKLNPPTNTVNLQFVFTTQRAFSVRRFRRQMRNWPSNPIVSRAVYLNFRPSYLETYAFLQEFGIHIWHLTISVYNQGCSRQVFANILRKGLLCVPNLRSLCLTCHYSPSGNSPPFYNELLFLDQFFRKNPLPPLPYLKSLDMGCTKDEFETYLYQQINDAYGCQIDSLLYGLDVSFHRSFVNVTDLCFVVDSTDQLLYLKRLSSPVKMLELCIMDKQGVLVGDLFLAAWWFKATLESLTFCLNGIRIDWRGVENVNLNFARLKQLCFYNVVGWDMKFDFLEKLPNLSQLYVVFESYQALNFMERVQVHKYLDGTGKPNEKEFYKSNIWKVVPCLERVVFGRYEIGGYGGRVSTVITRQRMQYFREERTRRIGWMQKMLPCLR